MLKKRYILFLSLYLCAVVGHSELSSYSNNTKESLKFGLAAWVACTVIPNIIEKSDDRKSAILAGVATLGICALFKWYVFDTVSDEILIKEALQKGIFAKS